MWKESNWIFVYVPCKVVREKFTLLHDSTLTRRGAPFPHPPPASLPALSYPESSPGLMSVTRLCIWMRVWDLANLRAFEQLYKRIYFFNDKTHFFHVWKNQVAPSWVVKLYQITKGGHTRIKQPKTSNHSNWQNKDTVLIRQWSKVSKKKDLRNSSPT